MTPPEITDKSLLRRTVKKSWHTAERLLLAVCYAIVGIALAAIVTYGAINILPKLYESIFNMMTIIVSVLALVPMWVYGIAAIPLAIFGYSFLWCVARDLTDEDWKSGAADTFALSAIALALAFAFALAIAPTALAVLALASTPVLAAIAILALTSLASTAAIVILVALAHAVLAAFAVEPVDKITVWYYVFRFPGAAYHHYFVKEREG